MKITTFLLWYSIPHVSPFNRRPCDPKFRYQGLGFSTWTGSVEVSRMRKHQRSSWCHQLPFSYKLHPRKLTVFPWKLMVGRCIPYWNGHFLEDMLVFRGVLGGGFNGSARLKNMIVNNYSTHIAVVESSNLKFETWNSLFFNPMSPTVTNCLTITSYSRGVFFSPLEVTHAHLQAVSRHARNASTFFLIAAILRGLFLPKELLLAPSCPRKQGRGQSLLRIP